MFLIVVTFFSLAALYVIISVGLGWLPLIGHCVNAERINIVLLNLSYSYVASVLFFCMIELIPRWLNKKKAFKVFEKDLDVVYRKIGEMISVLKMMAETDTENKKLKVSDFSSLSVCRAKYRCTYIKATIGKGSERGVIDCYALLKHHSNLIKKKLQNILELPLSSNLQSGFLTLLLEVKQNELLDDCAHHLKSRIPHESDFSIFEFDKKVCIFIQQFQKLSTSFKQKQLREYVLLNETEIVEVKQQLVEICKELNNYGFDIHGIGEIHKNRAFMYLYALPEEYKKMIASND